MLDIFKNYITSKNVIFFIIAILFIVFITKIKDIAILFFASYVISCSLKPLVDKFVAKKMKRSTAASIVLFLSFLVVSLFFIPILVMSGHQISSFMHFISQHFDVIEDYITSLSIFQNTEISQLDFGGLLSSASGLTSNVVSSSITFTKQVGMGIIYMLAACIIIYYFLADEEIVKNAYLSIFPSNMKKRAEEIIESISRKIGGYVVAQIVTMLSVGVIISLGLALLGVDYALLLGTLTAIFDIVPIFLLMNLMLYKL